MVMMSISASNSMIQRIFNWFRAPAAQNQPQNLVQEIKPSNLGSFNPCSFPEEMTILVLRLLDTEELIVVDVANRFFRSRINIACQRNALSDVKVWEENIGQIVGDIPMIPKNYIEKARFSLPIFFPASIAIEVDENSPLELREGRLIENPDKMAREDEAGLEPTGTKKELVVPVTLRNILLLAEKYSKKGPSQFNGIKYVWDNIRDQHGDEGISDHWSSQLPQVQVRSLGDSYAKQNQKAQEKGLEVVSVLDRILFDLFRYMKSGKSPQSQYYEQTSTVTLDNSNNPQRSIIGWTASGPSFRVSLFRNSYGIVDVGFTVGVPAAS